MVSQRYRHYRQTSTISCTKSQSLNVSRLVMELPLPTPLKPGVKLIMKMWLEQRRQAYIISLRDMPLLPISPVQLPYFFKSIVKFIFKCIGQLYRACAHKWPPTWAGKTEWCESQQESLILATHASQATRNGCPLAAPQISVKVR